MNKTYYVPQIQQMAMELPLGQSGRFMCPVCNGGSSKEKSLSVTRRSETEASFNCFRNKCNLGGGHVALFSDVDGNVLKYNSTPKKPANNDITHNLASLDMECVEFFMNKYHMTPAMLAYGRFQTTFDRRIYMWIFGPRRLKRGGSVRKYKELYVGRREYTSIPKNMIHYNGTDNLALSWYFHLCSRRKASDTLIIVEDIPSALRLTPYTDAVALLGTAFSPEKQREVRRMGYDRIILALDEDATAKAIKIKQECSLYLPSLEVLPLVRDIKDCTVPQLEEVLDVKDVA